MKNLTSSARKKLGNHFGPLLAGSIALFCVWFCNGLWHGSAWGYIFFGMYHFVLILSGNIIAPAVTAFNKKLIALAFIFVISVLNEKGICVRGAIAKRNVVIRWVAVYALIMFIIIFGAYGKGYVAVDPIYANF